MALADVLGQALHNATVVPRLYTAALQAGLGHSGAVEVLLISQASLRAAATHGRGVPGRVNAMRHFMWQAVLTARFGSDVARTLAAAQEAGTPHHRDSSVDKHNNAAGQAYGITHVSDLTPGSPSDACALLVPVALAKWDADELIWIRRH